MAAYTLVGWIPCLSRLRATRRHPWPHEAELSRRLERPERHPESRMASRRSRHIRVTALGCYGDPSSRSTEPLSRRKHLATRLPRCWLVRMTVAADSLSREVNVYSLRAGSGLSTVEGSCRDSRMESGPEQPTGTVTLVFTDIEGSTVLLRDLGAEAYRDVLGEHRRVVRAAFADHGGYEVDEEGDAFFFAFASAPAAVAAVREATARLADGPVRVRVGVHTGEPLVDPPNYVGEDVHLAARIMSAGHGGQVLLSQTTRALVEGELRELGEHRLKDFPEAVALFQLGDGRFPPLRTISNTNLPRPVSSFVGREREVEEVVSLVRDRGARLVTLSGPGGTGKTRLAIEAAAELVGDFAAGVYWVELARRPGSDAGRRGDRPDARCEPWRCRADRRAGVAACPRQSRAGRRGGAGPDSAAPRLSEAPDARDEPRAPARRRRDRLRGAGA